MQILIIEHSLVRDLEQEHRQEDFGANVEVVYATYPRFISGGLKEKLKDHLDYTFVCIYSLHRGFHEGGYGPQ